MNILYVCVENSCRSQLAEALTNLYRTKHQVDISAYSAGSNPSGQINPKAIESMNLLGYDLKKHGSKSLQEIPQIEYDAVITMGCGDECPFIGTKYKADWGLPDPKHMHQDDFNKIRDLISSHIEALISQLTGSR